MINYNNRKFRPVSNSENGETSADTVFLYKQIGDVLTSSYSGGEILQGHLMGQVDAEGNIEMCYHQINRRGELNSGLCRSRPELMENGKIRLFETWQWFTGDKSKGESILEEI
ncbi:hypothetical protein ADIS_3732 [Lunatimonas lonarensis]|uniref:N-acetylglutamate synthase n=1 Tax=Lunatimonas lonarensis TaxID=1232681 RepID=R7ZNZ5_9BACT|nr:hypothetical protein [Lunatimonas lonarensis]EON75841.1 hypothetical protein ADIS_3732 [Lunatimonas lonarensis]